MISALSRAAIQGPAVELWSGEHMIAATVVWRKGTQAGLRSDARVPLDHILDLDRRSLLQLTAPAWPEIERRKRARNHEENRLKGRAMEFVGIAFITTSLAAGLCMIIQETLAGPLSTVKAEFRN